MKKPGRRLETVFSVLMLLFCLLMIAYVPLKAVLDFRMSEALLNLETSRGRERRQQYEYDQVSSDLPLTRAELETAQPLADAALQEVTDLKALRKELRAKKKRLESLLENASDAALSNASGDDPSTDGEERAGHE